LNLGVLTPEFVIAGTAILVVLLDLVIPRKGWLAGISIAGIVISAGFCFAMWGGSQSAFNGMLVLDNFALFFKLIFLGIAAMLILASVDYVSKLERFQGEYYAMMLLASLGMMLMAATTELITIYISLELASISLYALSGFMKDKKSSESSLKYLLLGAIASAVLLFGMAMVFGFTGQTQLGAIADTLKGMSVLAIVGSPGLLLGIILLIAGFGFKIAAFPFHMWVPDVYEGAPTPITAFLSAGSKAAGFAIILRVFFSAFSIPVLSINWALLIAVLSAIGMFVGNLTALRQGNIKRMLGYSSIAQAGYIMMGLATMGLSGAADIVGRSSVIFFLASYALTNLGAFIAIIAITNRTDSDEIDSFAGMFKRAPMLSIGLSLCLISLIGMPPAAGFIAKFYLFSGAITHGLLWLVIVAVINSVISAYYYLRVVKVMWFGEPASQEKVPSSGALRFALAVSCLGVLVLGVVPWLVMRYAEVAANMFLF